MKKANYARTLYALCIDPSVECHLLRQIQQALELPLEKIKVEELALASPMHPHKILLINYQQHQTILDKMSLLPYNPSGFETILYNVPRRLATEELIPFCHLKALYYDSDPIEDIAHGCKEVINGINCLPRNVMCQLLHYYRHIVTHHPTRVTVELTCREIQILRSLQTGASNAKIADALFISEFTVKSHLYQIFKKLAVKNRVQAIAWANRNLVTQ